MSNNTIKPNDSSMMLLIGDSSSLKLCIDSATESINKELKSKKKIFFITKEFLIYDQLDPKNAFNNSILVFDLFESLDSNSTDNTLYSFLFSLATSRRQGNLTIFLCACPEHFETETYRLNKGRFRVISNYIDLIDFNNCKSLKEVEYVESVISDILNGEDLIQKTLLKEFPSPPSYKIKTFQDMLDCTNEDNLADFIQDLSALMAAHHSVRKTTEEICEKSGIAKEKARMLAKDFVWTDDGKRNIKINVLPNKS